MTAAVIEAAERLLNEFGWRTCADVRTPTPQAHQLATRPGPGSLSWETAVLVAVRAGDVDRIQWLVAIAEQQNGGR